MMDYALLLQNIESSEIITVFRHTNPDCDAVGSQFGLVNWIHENWPEKKVYALGEETSSQGEWPESDNVEDAIIHNSLAIVLDTANKERIDDARAMDAKKVLKVDHHPNRESFGDEELVMVEAAATCEILTHFMHSCSDQTISKKTASYLYQGLLTDTLNYQTSNTTANTLLAGSILAQTGINLPVLARNLWDKSISDFKFANMLRSKIEYIHDNQIAYACVSLKNMEECSITASKARSFVDELGHVKDFIVWLIVTEKEANGEVLYDASIRSKYVTINDIAEKYHGGGHKNAAGVKNMNKDAFESLLKDLSERVESMN